MTLKAAVFSVCLRAGARYAMGGESALIISGPVSAERGLKKLWIVGKKRFQDFHLGSEATGAESTGRAVRMGPEKHPRENDNETCSS